MSIGRLSIGNSSPVEVRSANDVLNETVDLSTMTGATQTVQLYNAANTSVILTQSVYFPLAFSGTLPDTIRPDSTITWNADLSNSRGVVLLMQSGTDIKDIFEATRHVLHIPDDDGDYTFTAQDLSFVQAGDKMIEIKLVRGDYSANTLVTDPHNNNAIYVINMMTGYAQL